MAPLQSRFVSGPRQARRRRADVTRSLFAPVGHPGFGIERQPILHQMQIPKDMADEPGGSQRQS
jgi:hypothetical protein